MTIWIDTDNSTRLGVVLYNYDSKPEPHLKLSIGETVHILKQCPAWYYGYSLTNRKKEGIFPKSFIYIKPCIIEQSNSRIYDTVIPDEPTIVKEITSVLREWGIRWKQVFIQNNGESFQIIKRQMKDLIDHRKHIISRQLTKEELKELQKRITNEIDMGNARLGLDLVVRDGDGNIVDPMTTSTISIYRQGEETLMNLWKQGVQKHRHLVEHKLSTQKRQEERESGVGSSSHRKSTDDFSLYVSVKNFVCKIGEDSTVLMTLYDAERGTYISESFVQEWNSQGVPKNLDLLSNLRVLFTDLGEREKHCERIYIVCMIIRNGRMDWRETDNKKETLGLKRPFGVAVYEVTDILKRVTEMEDEKESFIPFQPCGEKENLDNLVKKVLTLKEVNHKGQGLFVTMRKLSGDFKQVQKDYPHLVASPTAVCRKMGFTDVIMPDDVRNDLYVTICHGDFKSGGKNKNLEVTMCVCNQDGHVLEGVITEGPSGQNWTYYKSVIYYHEDKPKWYETVKVAIPIKDFYGSHLKFTFKHRSSADAKDKAERPFALSFVKLMQQNRTVLSDGDHELMVYKLDTKRIDTSTAYLKLHDNVLDDRVSISSPRGSSSQGGHLSLSADTFAISTLVCSTKVTHSVDLMGLLQWRDNSQYLQRHLEQFTQIDGEEVVKFLQDILDALFNILIENSNKKDADHYDNLVFDVLVFLIDLVSESKYKQFRPVLDVYIEENFSATLAYNKLMVVLKYYIDNVDKNTRSTEMTRTMKALEYIFKFIIKSRVLFAALNDNKGQQQFEISLKNLFASLINMMKILPNLLPIQGACLRYFPTVIADVITVLDPEEFSLTVVEFLRSVTFEKLQDKKMACMKDIVHTAIFSLPGCRRILLPVILEHVKKQMERGQVLDMCVVILSDIMDTLFSKNSCTTDDDLNTITLTCLRTVTQTVIGMDRQNPLIGSCVAVMTAILRQMEEPHYDVYIKQLDTSIDQMDFLMEILMVYKDLVFSNVFPKDWNEMIMLQNSVFLKTMRYYADTINQNFSGQSFIYQLWATYFQSAIAFLTQEPLQLERFTSTKRNKIISRYKDMRREAGFEIRAMWFNLGHNKIKFIPSLVGSILEMTLIPETELRKATIPLFFDMMLCEFMSSPDGNPQHIKGSFSKFEHALITELDRLVEKGMGDDQYKELFYARISELCSQQKLMKDAGQKFCEMVKQLLQRLLEYRDLINDENKENRMSCTVNLLIYYQELQRQEMYVKYLHKLCDLHLECDNFTEAAYTILQYAMLLPWSNKTLVDSLKSPRYPNSHLERELKQDLFYEAISYFDKGKMWEKGIELCKELAVQLETELFDYIELSKLLKMESDFYDRIMKQIRPEAEYFRVGYYGLGFPSFIQNKVYIYRGKEYERLSDFTAGLQNQFPHAQIMKTLNAPGEDIKKSKGQYLQINAVSPILQLKRQFKNKRVHEQILKYYKVNEVQTFTYSRKKDESSNNLASMWLERTDLVTTESLPGILRWFPVTTSQVFEVSPLENAIETLEGTNKKIKGLIDQHTANPDLRVDSLGMVLNGVVDAAVNGGIANFADFYTEKYYNENPTHQNRFLTDQLKKLTTLQLVLLQTGLDMHRERAPDSLLPFQAHMDQRFNEMKAFVETEYSIQLTDEIRNEVAKKNLLPVKRSKTMVTHRPRYSESPQKKQGSPVLQAKFLGGSRTPSAINVNRSASMAGSGLSNRDSGSSTSSKFINRLVNKSPRGSTASLEHMNHKEGTPSPRSSYASSKGGDRDSQIIELSQELTPKRPLRPDSERKSLSRANSGQIRLSRQNSGCSTLSTNSTISTYSEDSALTLTADRDSRSLSDFEIDGPPPLPSKQVSVESYEPEHLPALPTKNSMRWSSSTELPGLSLAPANGDAPAYTDIPAVPPKPPKKPTRPPLNMDL